MDGIIQMKDDSKYCWLEGSFATLFAFSLHVLLSRYVCNKRVVLAGEIRTMVAVTTVDLV